MNQFVAIRRRFRAAVASAAIVAAVAVYSSLTPAPARAQSDAKPATPAPASNDTTAETGKQPPAKLSKKDAKKALKNAPKHAKADKATAAATSKPAKAPRAAKAAKASKPAKVREPEKSMAEQRKEDGIYAKRSNWLTLRFGYAKRTGDVAGDGMVGYGVGYTRMLTRRVAFAAGVGHDVMGHFGPHLDEAVPFTGEFRRHFKWNSSVRPYVGIGGGFYLRKSYRSGDYATTTTGGPHFSLGFLSAPDANHVIGFETRVARLNGDKSVVDPTFGPEGSSVTIWTAKLSWGLVY